MTSLLVRDGLILLDKPADVTSFKALAVVKKSLQVKKVGHAGTLDKFATGLLLVLTGRYTRLVPYFCNLDKEYLATFRFGAETATLDPEGELIRTGRIPSREELIAVLDQFTGEILQIPPFYSAVHVKGQRAYELAKQGIQADLSPRLIRIHRLEVLDYTPPELTLRIYCSKGTYIRALARDIGQACGSCAFVTSLRRTLIGPFRVDEAVSSEKFNPETDLRSAQAFLPLLDSFTLRTIPPAIEEKILKGMQLKAQRLSFKAQAGEKIALLNQGGKLVALVEYQDDGDRESDYRYLAVFNMRDD